MTIEEINKEYFSLIRERIRIEQVDEELYPEFNRYHALDEWEEDIVNFVEKAETLPYNFIKNRLDEDFKRWQGNMIMEVSEDNFNLIYDREAIINKNKEANVEKGDIYIGQRLFFYEDNEEYEVFSIREERDPKIYLQGTIYDTEKQVYKSDLIGLIKTHKVEEIKEENKINNLKNEKSMEAQAPKGQKNYQTQFKDYEFDTTQPLITKDVYAYFSKGGTPEFLSQKMSELAGKEIVIPQYIKNDVLWNDFVKPFRELPQEVQTTLKNELINSLKAPKQEQQQAPAEQTPQQQAPEPTQATNNKKELGDMDEYYRNQYEINPEKQLNKHDILAFYFQYGKGAQNKLLELASSFLGEPVTIEVRNGKEFEDKIVNPIKNRGVFAGTEFKNILVENISQQKAYREEQAMQNDDNSLFFDNQKKELFTVTRNGDNIEMVGIPILSENNKKITFNKEEWSKFKQENKNKVWAKQNTYKEGDEMALGFTNSRELYQVTKIEKGDIPALNSLHLETIEADGKKTEMVMMQYDIDIYVAQNKAKQITPEMKEKGFVLNRDHDAFNLEHLKRLDPSKGVTDRNLYAIINLKLNDDLDKTRREMLEKYTGVPFDELKKYKKDDMIKKVYEIKRGADKNKEFNLKSDIQKLFLSSEGQRNLTAPEAYEKYLEGLTLPDKGLFELQHVDMLLLQSKDLTNLFEGTPLENDNRVNNILKMFDEQDRDAMLHSKEFHMGDKELEAKQYLLNAINHSENKEQMTEVLTDNLAAELNSQKSLKR